MNLDWSHSKVILASAIWARIYILLVTLLDLHDQNTHKLRQVRCAMMLTLNSFFGMIKPSMVDLADPSNCSSTVLSSSMHFVTSVDLSSLSKLAASSSAFCLLLTSIAFIHQQHAIHAGSPITSTALASFLVRHQGRLWASDLNSERSWPFSRLLNVFLVLSIIRCRLSISWFVATTNAHYINYNMTMAR